MDNKIKIIHNAFNKIKNELNSFQQQLNSKKELVNHRDLNFLQKISKEERKEIIKNVIQRDKEVAFDYQEMKNKLNSSEFANLTKREKILITNQERSKLIKKIRDSIYLKDKIIETKNSKAYDSFFNQVNDIKITKNKNNTNSSFGKQLKNDYEIINEIQVESNVHENEFHPLSNNDFLWEEFKEDISLNINKSQDIQIEKNIEFFNNKNSIDNSFINEEAKKENIIAKNIENVELENNEINDNKNSFNEIFFQEPSQNIIFQEQVSNDETLVQTQNNLYEEINIDSDYDNSPKQDMVITKDFLENLKNSGGSIGKDFKIEKEADDPDNYIKNTDDDMWLFSAKTEAEKPKTNGDYSNLKNNEFLNFLKKK